VTEKSMVRGLKDNCGDVKHLLCNPDDYGDAIKQAAVSCMGLHIQPHSDVPKGTVIAVAYPVKHELKEEILEKIREDYQT
jgi:hypothetical protein